MLNPIHTMQFFPTKIIGQFFFLQLGFFLLLLGSITSSCLANNFENNNCNDSASWIEITQIEIYDCNGISEELIHTTNICDETVSYFARTYQLNLLITGDSLSFTEPIHIEINSPDSTLASINTILSSYSYGDGIFGVLLSVDLTSSDFANNIQVQNFEGFIDSQSVSNYNHCYPISYDCFMKFDEEEILFDQINGFESGQNIEPYCYSCFYPNFDVLEELYGEDYCCLPQYPEPVPVIYYWPDSLPLDTTIAVADLSVFYTDYSQAQFYDNFLTGPIEVDWEVNSLVSGIVNGPDWEDGKWYLGGRFITPSSFDEEYHWIADSIYGAIPIVYNKHLDISYECVTEIEILDTCGLIFEKENTFVELNIVPIEEDYFDNAVEFTVYATGSGTNLTLWPEDSINVLFPLGGEIPFLILSEQVGFGMEGTFSCDYYGNDYPMIFNGFNTDTIFVSNNVITNEISVEPNCHFYHERSLLPIIYSTNDSLSPDTVFYYSNVMDYMIEETFFECPLPNDFEDCQFNINVGTYINIPWSNEEYKSYLGGFFKRHNGNGSIGDIYGAIPIVQNDIFEVNTFCYTEMILIDTCNVINLEIEENRIDFTFSIIDNDRLPLEISLELNDQENTFLLDTILSESIDLTFEGFRGDLTCQLEMTDAFGVFYELEEYYECPLSEPAFALGGLNVDTVIFCNEILLNEDFIEPCVYYIGYDNYEEVAARPKIYWSLDSLASDTIIATTNVETIGEYNDLYFNNLFTYPLSQGQFYGQSILDIFDDPSFSEGYFYMGSQLFGINESGNDVSISEFNMINGAFPVLFYNTPTVEIIGLDCSNTLLCGNAGAVTINDLMIDVDFEATEYHLQVFSSNDSLLLDSTLTNFDDPIGNFNDFSLTVRLEIPNICGTFVVEQAVNCPANFVSSGMELNNAHFPICGVEEVFQVEPICTSLSAGMFSGYALITESVLLNWQNETYFEALDLNTNLEAEILSELIEYNTDGLFSYNANYENDTLYVIGLTGWGDPENPNDLDRIFLGSSLSFHQAIEVDLVDFDFLCYGDCYTLSYEGDYDFEWIEADSISIMGQSIEVCPEVSTGYRLNATNENACIGTDSMTIFVTTDVPLLINGKTGLVPYCGESVQLSGALGYSTYEWSTGENTVMIQVSSEPGYVTYSLTASPGFDCFYTTSIQTFRDTACVLPGDANHNGIANHYDLLPLALAFNQTGIERWNAEEEWEEQPCEDWNNQLFGSLNAKHSDCDGNGLVDEFDLEVLLHNYGLGSSQQEMISPIETSGIPLYFEMPTETLSHNQEIAIPIMLSNFEEINAYGLAFEAVFDPTLIQTESIQIDWSENWLGDENEVITLFKKESGLLQIALARTNQTNAYGKGQIGTLRFTVEADLAYEATLPFAFQIKAPLLLTAEETILPIVLPNQAGLLIGLSELSNESFNFIQNENHLIFSDGTNIEQLFVYDLSGKLVKTTKQLESSLDLNELPNGLYLLHIYTQSNVYSKKVQIIH